MENSICYNSSSCGIAQARVDRLFTSGQWNEHEKSKRHLQKVVLDVEQKQIEAKRSAESEHLTKIERSLLAQKAMNQTTIDAFFT